MTSRILVAEDMEINRVILQSILEDTYIIDMAEDGMEALNILEKEEKPALILSDIMMPNMGGYEFLARVKAEPKFQNIPFIFITSSGEEDKGLAAGAIDFILKPFNPEIVRLRVDNQIELSAYRESLEHLVTEKAFELTSTREAFLETIVSMIEYRSLESGEHIRRTRDLTAILVDELLKHEEYGPELKAKNYKTISRAATLHDVGKIGIPDSILLKPGPLTPEEFKVIETHTVIGGDMIISMMKNRKDDYLMHCYDIARHHHERFDGTGYPDKLKGREIPISARIVALVDMYDALVNERCYKDGMNFKDAAEIIRNKSGAHFDEVVVTAFFNAEAKIRSISGK
jgi:putative two-component system response regulator